MFYENSCRPKGQISDYRLDDILKVKSLNFYVRDLPLVSEESAMFQDLYAKLPKGLPYGVRTRVWKDFYPDVQFFGEMVGYTAVNEAGQAVETLVLFENFVMADVPWEEIVA